MVRAGLRFAVLAVMVLPFVSNLSAKEFADYQPGDKAEEDIVAPARLTIMDADGTEELRQKEALKVPVVIRFYTNTAGEVEAQFRREFGATRESFLGAVNGSFGHRTLTAEELHSPKFSALAILFENQNELFPISTNRAALWAGGDADETYETAIAETLRRAMSSPIQPGIFPALTSTVRLVPLARTNETLNAQTAGQRGKNLSRENLLALADVKKDFQRNFAAEEPAVANYLAALLKPNCAVDDEATRELRAKSTEALWAVDNYETGQIIAHRGQVIDKKIKAALDQLKEKSVLGQLQELQRKQQAAVSQLQAMAAKDKIAATPNPERGRWLLAVLAVAVLILTATIWQLARRKQTVSLLPVPAGEVEQWQQRALMAEQRAEKAQTMIRNGAFAQLAQWLSNYGVRGLVSQRTRLLNSQEIAANEMAELEARLEKIQAPLQDRLQAYERRIGELEKELSKRGAENRELIKTKLEVVRNQLELKRGTHQLIVHPGTPNAWEIRLKPGSNTIGRGPVNDFKIDDPSVSICHCEIIFSETGVMIKDLNSTNGTRVNGVTVQSAALRPGQRIRLGSVEISFSGAAPLPSLAVTQPLSLPRASKVRWS
jgi:hypothetical protein